jgi:hypothetical protein
MPTIITESIIALSDNAIDNSTKAVLNYYDRVNDIVKRTHNAMGRTAKPIQTLTASTIHGTIIATNSKTTN